MSPTYRVAGIGNPNCTLCGETGKIHGDPQRGWCMRHRHMIGSNGTCDDFTTVKWIERLQSTTNT